MLVAIILLVNVIVESTDVLLSTTVPRVTSLVNCEDRMSKILLI